MAQRTCSVPECDRPVHSRDMCTMHVKRLKRTGSPLATKSGRVVGAHGNTCTHPGCDQPHKSKGYCALHANRARRGIPMDAPVRRAPGAPRPPRAPAPEGWTVGQNGTYYPPVEQRFWSRVTPDPSGCWLWSGATDRDGYGRFAEGHGDTQTGAHRWSYEHMVGPIPDGLELDHLCVTPACVNPYHLDPVTTKVNNERRAARKRAAA